MGKKQSCPMDVEIPALKFLVEEGYELVDCYRERLLALQTLQLDRDLAFDHYARVQMKRHEAENEKMKEKGMEEGSLVLRYNSKLDSTFHTAFQTKWEGPYKVEKKFKNGSYQLTDLDGKRHKRRVNGIRLKKYFAL